MVDVVHFMKYEEGFHRALPFSGFSSAEWAYPEIECVMAEVSEVEDRASLRDRWWVDRPGDVLLDPRGSSLGRLVRACLVVADRHGHPAVTASKCCVLDEARNPADEFLHVLLALAQEIEELRRTLPRVASKDY